MKALRSIVSLALAALVLVASSSFTVNMHLCGGSVQSVSLIEKATPCPMEINTPPCHKAFAKRSCCDDEQFTYSGQDFKNQQAATVQIAQQAWVSDLPVLAQVVPVASVSYPHHTFYKPPLLQHDIPVLIQSFLI
jgi:hypothetical protein